MIIDNHLTSLTFIVLLLFVHFTRESALGLFGGSNKKFYKKKVLTKCLLKVKYCVGILHLNTFGILACAKEKLNIKKNLYGCHLKDLAVQ